MFEAQRIVCAFALDLLKAGRSSEARIVMMAMTTRSPISVKPAERRRPALAFEEIDGASFMSFRRVHGTNRLCKLCRHESSGRKRMHFPRSGSRSLLKNVPFAAWARGLQDFLGNRHVL